MAPAAAETDFERGHATLRARLLPIIVVAIALVFVYASLSPGFVSGKGAFWQHLEGDASRSEIGWIYYAHDDWRLPLFAIGNYHDPEGSNVYLSDSLPLFALSAKVLFRLTGWLPTYMGFWVALCFFLQVICASRLLRALGIRALLPHLAGVVVLSYTPALFLRFGHLTLMAHFFILAELEGYVRAKRDGLGRRGWFWVCALPVMAILVQPYIAVMTLLLALITIGDQWRERKLSALAAGIRIGAIAGAALAVIILGGFIFRNTMPHNDYGLYSLNLLAPFVPFADTWLGARLGTATPSLPDIWQWEGGSYLGMGALLLVLLSVPFWRLVALRRHAVLLAGFAAMLVFAVSNRVGLGTHELLHFPLPAWVESLFSAFRAGGRFVWPVMYAVIAAAIAGVAQHYSRYVATGILVVAAVLQWLDVQPMQVQRRGASAMGQPSTIHEQRWRELIAAHERLFQFPSFECRGLFGDGVPGTIYRELEIDLIAARMNRPTNSAYEARFIKDCAREQAQAGLEMTRPGTLYLYRSSENVGAYLAAHGQDVRHCGALDDVVVCSASADLSALR